MPDIATAFTNAQLVSVQQTVDRAAARGQRAGHGLALSDMNAATIGEQQQMHCYDPWLIGRAEPNRERRARESLMRDGFECWYPAGRRMSALPQRFISSKTRHKKRHVLVEDVRMPYPGYLFMRRLTAVRPLPDLYELTGVLGICTFGEQIATIEDYRIEMMRIHEDAGFYDEASRTLPNMSERDWALAEIRQTDAAKDRWSKRARTLGRLDSNQRGGLHLVEEFGRITRIIAATGDIPLPGGLQREPA